MLGWLSYVRHALALTLTVAAAVLPAAADDSWQDRGDRYEGIRAENVSGGDFELLAVQVEPGRLDRQEATLYVAVPLREEAELRIRVWDPHSHYWMTPKRKAFAPGDDYSWSRATVLGPAGIDVGRLCVLATNPTETLYYPARLTTGDPHAAVTGYRFRFHSRGGVELDFKIAREVDGRLIPVVENERNEDFGGSRRWGSRGLAPWWRSIRPRYLLVTELLGKLRQPALSLDVTLPGKVSQVPT